MIDTNVFISMIFFPSTQTRELAKRLTAQHQIIVCDYVVEELRLVVERKFPAKKRFLEDFFMQRASYILLRSGTGKKLQFWGSAALMDIDFLRGGVKYETNGKCRIDRFMPDTQGR